MGPAHFGIPLCTFIVSIMRSFDGIYVINIIYVLVDCGVVRSVLEYNLVAGIGFFAEERASSRKS